MDRRTDKEREQELQEERKLEGQHDVGAEEFSEKMYDENSPTPPEFEIQHDVSVTGSPLREET